MVVKAGPKVSWLILAKRWAFFPYTLQKFYRIWRMCGETPADALKIAFGFATRTLNRRTILVEDPPPPPTPTPTAT